MASSSHPLGLLPPTSTLRPRKPSFHPPRLRNALSLLLLFACLATTSLAQGEAQPPFITSTASISTALSSIQVSGSEGPRETLVTAGWDELRRRKDSDAEEEDQSTKTSEKTKDSKKASRTTITISKEKATSTAAASQSPLPEPFDGNIETEYTSSASSNCPTFLTSLIESPSFEACYPLSMLIQTSRGFFEAQKQLLSIVRVLDATCAANVTFCTDYLGEAAKNLTATENCKSEYNDGDSTVKQVLYGLQAYEMMYKASCLQTPDDDMYCFANAVTNLTTPSDAYFYYLPYNLSLPGSSVPSCSWCIEETMAIFHAASADRDETISLTYEGAARQVNTICGPGFVNGTLPKAEVSAGPIFVPSWVSVTITICIAALFNSVL
ncbi:hypothetical protein G7046_g5292 [Stylonectria norvegica]|nr:hypothetical protein G7046_g5292 [Stylonectria norvegica]